MVGLLHSDAVIKNVSVEDDLDEGLPLVMGDRVQLQQVLLNLMINGFDAMEDIPGANRTLLVRTSQEPHSMVQVSVSDTGTGLGGQNDEDLFTPFKTTKEKGMGMGLAVCRSIIEAHLGRIWAEDNSEGGASFHFTVPSEALAQSA